MENMPIMFYILAPTALILFIYVIFHGIKEFKEIIRENTDKTSKINNYRSDANYFIELYSNLKEDEKSNAVIQVERLSKIILELTK